MRNFWILWKRETLYFWLSPMAYIIMAIFLFIEGQSFITMELVVDHRMDRRSVLGVGGPEPLEMVEMGGIGVVVRLADGRARRNQRIEVGADQAKVRRIGERHVHVAVGGAKGPDREIGAHLHLSVKTIGTHREHLMAKLGIQSVAGLTKYAIREGLTSTSG